MKVFRYWSRATRPVRWPTGEGPLTCFGHSDASVGAADAHARERANASAQAIESGAPPQWYQYSDRALREEIVEEVEQNGTRVAAITRNRYGALILNTQHVLFADVDFPESNDGPGLGILKRLFGGGGIPTDPETRALERIRNVCAREAPLGMRVYRTARGLRCLAISDLYDPTERRSDDLLHSLGSDPLFRRLCVSQECFRARLTAKPWRIGLSLPPHPHFPWPDQASEAAARRWEDSYHAAVSEYAATEFIETAGPFESHPDAEAIVTMHDDIACAAGAPLA